MKTSQTTPLSEPERQLLVPYSTKANAFCGLHGSFFPIFFLPSSQKAFAFVEYGTRSCLSGSDRGVLTVLPLMVRRRQHIIKRGWETYSSMADNTADKPLIQHKLYIDIGLLNKGLVPYEDIEPSILLSIREMD